MMLDDVEQRYEVILLYFAQLRLEGDSCDMGIADGKIRRQLIFMNHKLFPSSAASRTNF